MNHTSQTDFQGFITLIIQQTPYFFFFFHCYLASPISNIQLPEKNPEEKEEKTKEDINYCKETFEAFVNKHKENIPKCFNFNKILNFVKVPFTSLPSLIQIKGFFHNYLLRYIIIFVLKLLLGNLKKNQNTIKIFKIKI